jgi:hypothetical protein
MKLFYLHMIAFVISQEFQEYAVCSTGSTRSEILHKVAASIQKFGHQGHKSNNEIYPKTISGKQQEAISNIFGPFWAKH